ncbi:MAG: biotin--[acetyl-CoA-carboxylase] ligase [Clostridia bacterium]|nr:biotin--[acetyl-CoA-carboxylase] ligase [Clostridia bacterium]
MKINKIHFDSIDSTNNYARNTAGKLALPALITAAEQTKGRGRNGKSFYSPANTGLYMTVLFKANENFGLITPCAAVCVCEALREYGAYGCRIKWVNDIYLDGKKICGILTERFSVNSEVYTSIGIGINLTTVSFPEEAGPAGSLGKDIPAQELAELIAWKILACNENPDRDRILRQYEAALFIKGKTVTFIIEGVKHRAKVTGINENCNLTLTDDEGNEHVLTSGEISIVINE